MDSNELLAQFQRILEENNARLEQRNAESQRKFQEELRRKYDQLQKLQDLKRKYDQLQKDHSELQKDHSELEKDHEELQKKYSKAKQDRDQISKKLKIVGLQNKSQVHVKNIFWKNSEEIPIEKLGTNIPEQTLRTLWKAICVKAAPNMEKEKSIQEFFDSAIPLILQHLGTDSIYSFLADKEIQDPRLRPIGILMMKTATSNKWTDAVLPLEYKLPNNRDVGIGQAIIYMSTMLEQQSFVHRQRGMCVFTDWATIVVCMIHDGTYSRTHEIELFGDPNEWNGKADSPPTSGFVLLCRMLASSFSDLGYMEIPKYVDVGSEKWPVQEVLGQGGDSIVYRCFKPQTEENYCVKVPIYADRSQLSVLKTESMYLNQIARKLSQETKFIIPEVILHPVNALVTRPVGVPLAQKVTCETSIQDIVRFGMKWLESIQILHKTGYVHNDIRPENAVVVDDDRVMLIDFQNPSQAGAPLSVLRFCTPQVPCRWVPILESSKFERSSPWDDIEQFVYGMSYLFNFCTYKWTEGATARQLMSDSTDDVFRGIVEHRIAYFDGLDTNLPERKLYDWLQQHRDFTQSPDYESLFELMDSIFVSPASSSSS